MSRVHDALRRAEQTGVTPPAAPPAGATVVETAPVAATPAPAAEGSVNAARHPAAITARAAHVTALAGGLPIVGPDFLSRLATVPFSPSPDSHLIDTSKPHEAPAEEFRTLRTRLNHLQTLQPIHTVVVTSPSPAEGKSFAAVNLALAEAQLEGNPTLLIDCDFRRPIVHNLFQVERTPGVTDYLSGKARLEDCIKHIAGSNLYILPAGEAVINPLELLNLREMRVLLEQLPKAFNWVILDSPPLLFAADANLLSTLSSGTVLVVRIGTTTIDSVTRAMQSLCENNVLGIIVNGARRGELYSKYTYYHSYYYAKPEEAVPVEETKA
ncbi:MAG TPA: CpsD/CapB family tyrosine-protein kinase [Bryobacteraceae bacterium]|nr:CpsD/CapB family tyrosine-protein kinase [Bryobacteraceae bacterium]